MADAETDPAHYLAQLLEQQREHGRKNPGGGGQKRMRLRCGVDVTVIRSRRQRGRDCHMLPGTTTKACHQ